MEPKERDKEGQYMEEKEEEEVGSRQWWEGEDWGDLERWNGAEGGIRGTKVW